MNHCVIMTVYKNADHINRLIKTLPLNWGIYIHIDKKSEIQESDIDSRAKVIKKWKIYWGSINHLKAVLDLLKLSLIDNCGFNYYHIISGQDYLASSPEKFDRILGENNNIYLDYFDIPYKRWDCWGEGNWIYQKRSLALFADVRYGVARRINNLVSGFQVKFGLLQRLPSYKLYGGPLYCSLTKEAVEEILNSNITAHLLKHLKFSLCGEEIFFQTILMNSPLRNKIKGNNLRYVDWSVEVPPKVLHIEDYDKIVDKNFLFCRKIEYPQSLPLLEKFNF